MNGTYRGVVDRIVDGKTVVIVLEDKDGEIGQLHTNVDELPGNAIEGSLIEVEFVSSELASIEVLEGETKDRRESLQNRFDRLSERL